MAKKMLDYPDYNNDIISAECEHIIERAHEGVISSLIVLPHNRIASSAEDLNIKIWCVKLFICLSVLSHHTDIITSMLSLHCKENLISMSFDSTLVIWNLRSYQSESVVDSIECWTPNGLIEIPNRRVKTRNPPQKRGRSGVQIHAEFNADITRPAFGTHPAAILASVLLLSADR